MMPIVNCKLCKKSFYTKPNWLKKGFGKYCSSKCAHKSQLNGKNVNCFICQKEVYRPLRRLTHSKSKKYFCGKSCQTIWRNSVVYVGSNHPNWKHGENTYKNLLLKSKTKTVCKLCGLKDIRTLAVHHIDKNRKNNHISNLVWLCHNCHHLTHHYLPEKQKLMEALV